MAGKIKDIKLMTVQQLSAYRNDLKKWLSTNDQHPRYKEGLEVLETVYEELRYRGVTNVDA